MESSTATYEDKFADLYREFVPDFGPADTKLGEILRAVNRIAGRWYNDGDRIGREHGMETCNPSASYLFNTCGSDAIRSDIRDMWIGDYGDSEVQGLIEDTVAYVDGHFDELKDTENHDDCLRFR